MPGRLSFEFHLGRAQPPASSRRGNDGPLRILVIGDFSGRRGSPDGARRPLSGRRLLPVDVDTLETRLRDLAPEVCVAGEDGAATTIALRGLDDFHPDQLARRIPLLDALRSLRGRLDDPADRAAAGETLQQLLAASGRAPAPGHRRRAGRRRPRPG